MMKEIVAWPVELGTNVTIPEMTLEHHAAANHINIPDTGTTGVPCIRKFSILSFL